MLSLRGTGSVTYMRVFCLAIDFHVQTALIIACQAQIPRPFGYPSEKSRYVEIGHWDSLLIYRCKGSTSFRYKSTAWPRTSTADFLIQQSSLPMHRCLLAPWIRASHPNLNPDRVEDPQCHGRQPTATRNDSKKSGPSNPRFCSTLGTT